MHTRTHTHTHKSVRATLVQMTSARKEQKKLFKDIFSFRFISQLFRRYDSQIDLLELITTRVSVIKVLLCYFIICERNNIIGIISIIMFFCALAAVPHDIQTHTHIHIHNTHTPLGFVQVGWAIQGLSMCVWCKRETKEGDGERYRDNYVDSTDPHIFQLLICWLVVCLCCVYQSGKFYAMEVDRVIKDIKCIGEWMHASAHIRTNTALPQHTHTSPVPRLYTYWLSWMICVCMCMCANVCVCVCVYVCVCL